MVSRCARNVKAGTELLDIGGVFECDDHFGQFGTVAVVTGAKQRAGAIVWPAMAGLENLSSSGTQVVRCALLSRSAVAPGAFTSITVNSFEFQKTPQVAFAVRSEDRYTQPIS